MTDRDSIYMLRGIAIGGIFTSLILLWSLHYVGGLAVCGA